MVLVTALTLERDESAGVADARVSNRIALAALLVTNPFHFWFDIVSIFQRSQSAEKNANGMSPADRVLRSSKIIRKLCVRISSRRGRDRKDIYGFVIKLGDGLVDGVVLRRSSAATQPYTGSLSCIGVIICVREPCSPRRKILHSVYNVQ